MNNIDMMEFRLSIYLRDNFKCQYLGCGIMGADNLELGHRISKGKANQLYIQRYLLENYGLDYKLKYIEENYIHNPINIVTSCRRHNDYFNCGFNVIETNKIIEKIYKKSLTNNSDMQ